jgi:hypothetical protein
MRPCVPAATLVGRVASPPRPSSPFWPAGGPGTWTSRDVVLAATEARRQAEVASGLAGDLVPEAAQVGRELSSREVSRESHTGMTLSFTTWRRITLGQSASSK